MFLSAINSRSTRNAPFFPRVFAQTGALKGPRLLLSPPKLDRYSPLPPFEDGGMTEVQIITSVHQTNPAEEARGEEETWGEGGEGAARRSVRGRRDAGETTKSWRCVL